MYQNNTTYIDEHLLRKLSNLEAGWQIFPSGVVAVSSIAKNFADAHLFDRVADDESLPDSLSVVMNNGEIPYLQRGLYCVAKGELKDAIIGNFAKKYDEMAHDNGYGSVIEMVAAENKTKWRKNGDKYIIHSDPDINSPNAIDEPRKGRLNFLEIDHKASFDFLSKSNGSLPYCAHYVAGEELAREIDKVLKDVPSVGVNMAKVIPISKAKERIP